MTSYSVGDLVAVEFPYGDLHGSKRRPGLVLAADDQDVLLARVTTHAPRDRFDVALREWSAVGLPRASTIRLSKLVTIDRRLVHHRIGRLHATDTGAVAKALQAFTSTAVAALNQ